MTGVGGVLLNVASMGVGGTAFRTVRLGGLHGGAVCPIVVTGVDGTVVG